MRNHSIVIYLQSIACFLFAAGATDVKAEDSTKRFYVIAERSLSSGTEQTSLIFEGSRVQFLANSDFLQPALGGGHAVRIGHFQAPLNDKLKQARRSLEESIATAVSPTPLTLYDSPHSVKIYIGSRRLGPENLAYSRIIRILSEASELTDWQPIDGSVVRLLPNGSLESTPTARGPARIDCSGAERACHIAHLGYIHLPTKKKAR